MTHSIQLILFFVSFGILFTYLNHALSSDLCTDIYGTNETMNFTDTDTGWQVGGSSVQSAIKMQQCKNLKHNSWWINLFVWTPIGVGILYAVIPFIKGG